MCNERRPCNQAHALVWLCSPPSLHHSWPIYIICVAHACIVIVCSIQNGGRRVTDEGILLRSIKRVLDERGQGEILEVLGESGCSSYKMNFVCFPKSNLSTWLRIHVLQYRPWGMMKGATSCPIHVTNQAISCASVDHGWHGQDQTQFIVESHVVITICICIILPKVSWLVGAPIAFSCLRFTDQPIGLSLGSTWILFQSTLCSCQLTYCLWWFTLVICLLPQCLFITPCHLSWLFCVTCRHTQIPHLYWVGYVYQQKCTGACWASWRGSYELDLGCTVRNNCMHDHIFMMRGILIVCLDIFNQISRVRNTQWHKDAFMLAYLGTIVAPVVLIPNHE